MSDTGLTGSLVPGVMVAAEDDVTVGLVPPGKAPYHIVHRPESRLKILSDPLGGGGTKSGFSFDHLDPN